METPFEWLYLDILEPEIDDDIEEEAEEECSVDSPQHLGLGSNTIHDDNLYPFWIYVFIFK